MLDPQGNEFCVVIGPEDEGDDEGEGEHEDDA
jgi:hypothetical protein